MSSLDQLAAAFGFENPDVVENAAERAKHFDISTNNCVQIAEQLTYWDAVSGICHIRHVTLNFRDDKLSDDGGVFLADTLQGGHHPPVSKLCLEQKTQDGC